MSLENQLHNEGDSRKEQRVTHLKNRFNQIKQKYPEDISIRKSIETVNKTTENIRLDYIADNAEKIEKHKSLLDGFQL